MDHTRPAQDQERSEGPFNFIIQSSVNYQYFKYHQCFTNFLFFFSVCISEQMSTGLRHILGRLVRTVAAIHPSLASR